MQYIENVVIAAAGMGKRLGYGLPKALVEVGGRKIIEYQLDLLKNVKNIYIVVGFCDEEVINFVKNIRRDVIFVRNPDYKHTKTLESYYLASKLIAGGAVFMDGDMIIDQADFETFLNSCNDEDMLVGVSKRITDVPVYAMIEDNRVSTFSYDGISEYEWANVVYINASAFSSGNENVFEYLNGFLPCKFICIDRVEVDTPEDLRVAEQYVADLCKKDSKHIELGE